jgi:hypothetical protein
MVSSSTWVLERLGMSNTFEYRDHSLGSKRAFDWRKWGAILALIVVVGVALVFMFFKFRPAVEAWRDEALAPFRTHPEKPVAPVGALTALQISAIESWVKIQKYQMQMDTFQWKLVRGPDSQMIGNHQVLALDVQVNWHQTGSPQTQHQVCRLGLQKNPDRSWMVIKAGSINDARGTVCNYAAGQ